MLSKKDRDKSKNKLSPEQREKLREKMAEDLKFKAEKAEADRILRKQGAEPMKVYRSETKNDAPQTTTPEPTQTPKPQPAPQPTTPKQADIQPPNNQPQKTNQPMAKSGSETPETPESTEPLKDNGANDIIDFEQFQDIVPTDDHNPISGETVVRDYTKIQNNPNVSGEIFEVPAMSFDAPPPPPTGGGTPPPTGGGFNPPPAPGGNGQPNQGGQSFNDMPQGEGPNQSFNNLDDKEKRIGSEMLVDGILDGYEKLHDLGNHFVQMPETDLVKLANEGKLDMSLRIPTEHGTISIAEFVSNFNTVASSAFVVDPDFRKDVRPAMVRIFLKRNWGVTDEQYVLGKFAMDIGTKMSIFFNLKAQIKGAIQSFSDTYTANKGKEQYIPPVQAPAGAGAATASSTAANVDDITYTTNPDGTLTDNRVHQPVAVETTDGE